jgi:hypothetical protein
VDILLLEFQYLIGEISYRHKVDLKELLYDGCVGFEVGLNQPSLQAKYNLFEVVGYEYYRIFVDLSRHCRFPHENHFQVFDSYLIFLKVDLNEFEMHF